MKRLSVPNPPNPDDAQFKNPLTYNRALFQWANNLKGALDALNNNYLPITPPFIPTAFTTQTTLTGTSTLGDVANFLCSLVQAMTNKGFTTPNQSNPAI